MISRLSSYVDKNSNGVVIVIEMLDEKTHKVVNFASVMYTPEVARTVAHDIVVNSDKADALGGPTAELLAVCTDKGGRRPKSAS